MSQYHKITTVFARDPENRYKTLIWGQWAKPEFGFLQGVDWVFTEKVDGTNVRVTWDGQTESYGGKTDNAQLHAGLVQHLRDTFSGRLADVFGESPAVLYGEGYGLKIQSGGGYLPDRQGFILFDVFCGIWLERENVEDIAKKLDIPVVPIIDKGKLTEAVDLVEHGMDSLLREGYAEGLVCRPAVELFNRRGERIITKIKHKDFPR